MLFSLNIIIQRHNIVATLAITTKDGGFSNKERRLVWMGVDNAPFPDIIIVVKILLKKYILFLNFFPIKYLCVKQKDIFQKRSPFILTFLFFSTTFHFYKASCSSILLTLLPSSCIYLLSLDILHSTYYIFFVLFMFQVVEYEGSNHIRNPEMQRVLLTHEVICRY